MLKGVSFMLKSIFLFILSSLFLFFEMGLQVSPGIMTNNLMRSLDIDIFWLGITSGAYFFTYTLMQIPAGLIYDRASVRYAILLPLSICIIGGFLFAMASNFYMAVYARIFMGFGSAFAFIGVLVVASHVFPERYFALSAGVAQMLAAMGAMCGTIPLIPLINTFGWRGTMFIINGFGFTLLVIMWFFLKLPNKRITNTAVRSLSIFIAVAKQKQTWLIAIYACLLWMPMAVVASLYGVPFVEKYFSLSFVDATIVITSMWIGIAIGSPVAGIIMDKTRQLKQTLVTMAILGMIAFYLILFGNISNITMLMILFFAAGNSCAGQVLSFSLISKNNKPEHRATAIGFNNMAVVISGFIFQPLIGFVIRYSEKAQKIVYNNYGHQSYFNGMLIVLFGYFIATITVIFFIKPPSNSFITKPSLR